MYVQSHGVYIVRIKVNAPPSPILSHPNLLVPQFCPEGVFSYLSGRGVLTCQACKVLCWGSPHSPRAVSPHLNGRLGRHRTTAFPLVRTAGRPWRPLPAAAPRFLRGPLGRPCAEGWHRSWSFCQYQLWPAPARSRCPGSRTSTLSAMHPCLSRSPCQWLPRSREADA